MKSKQDVYLHVNDYKDILTMKSSPYIEDLTDCMHMAGISTSSSIASFLAYKCLHGVPAHVNF
jgi:hypothetical protein